jgi:hypothetical protein
LPIAWSCSPREGAGSSTVARAFQEQELVEMLDTRIT